MTRSKSHWLVLGISLLGCLALPALSGCRKRDPVPPFKRGDVACGFRALVESYLEDETAADQRFKGKIIYLYETPIGPPPPPLHTDEAGDRYVEIWPGSKLPIRCYLYRPDDPVMEDRTVGLGGGLRGYDIAGICMGKTDGALVLRKCYYCLIVVEGADWSQLAHRNSCIPAATHADRIRRRSA
jgi:hypothetical protein